MLPKEIRIEKMYDFCKKYYNHNDYILIPENVFYDLLDFIECDFQDFTRYYQIFEMKDKMYYIK